MKANKKTTNLKLFLPSKRSSALKSITCMLLVIQFAQCSGKLSLSLNSNSNSNPNSNSNSSEGEELSGFLDPDGFIQRRADEFEFRVTSSSTAAMPEAEPEEDIQMINERRGSYASSSSGPQAVLLVSSGDEENKAEVIDISKRFVGASEPRKRREQGGVALVEFKGNNNNENALTQNSSALAQNNRLGLEHRQRRRLRLRLRLRRRRRKRFLPEGRENSDRLQTRAADSKNSDKESSGTQASTLTSAGETKSLKCRVEENLYLDFEEYKHYTCANCYKYMPKSLFAGKHSFKRGNRRQVWLYDEQARKIVLSNETDAIRPTFKDEQAFKKWNECCKHAIDCCIQNSIYLPKVFDPQSGELLDERGREKCHATWDGLSCWPDTQAGLIAEHDCPNHVYFFDFTPTCNGRVTKQCFSNGSWYIRADHEWSDYSNCAVLTLYATRLLIGSVWHVISAFIIGPALIVLDKLPNRGGSKRVRILSNLLFWLLVNGLLAATQKIGIIGGVFHKTNPDEPLPPPPPPSQSFLSNSTQSLEYLTRQRRSPLPAVNQVNGDYLNTTRWNGKVQAWSERLEKANEKFASKSSQICDDDDDDQVNKRPTSIQAIKSRRNNSKPSETYYDRVRKAKDAINISQQMGTTFNKQTLSRLPDNNQSLPYNNQILSALVEGRQQPQTTTTTTFITSKGSSSIRCKRSTTSSSNSKKQQSAPVVLICWIFSLGIRITRQLGYAWMFTGAVYLCSILHFAPAEPPALFIKWLMILTNGFPVVIALVYIIARTVYDRSPLTLLVKLPYYYISGDTVHVEYLWATQLDCWLSESKYSFIEEIADFPNLVLIILNGALFVITLIIMCRINRPGSTRQEMSLGDYFKAAGTLVVLYGAHYMLIAYRVQVEGCIKDQVIYYSFLFVDGIQGIAVSYVFCYRTPEGREIISRWWENCLGIRASWLLRCNRNQTSREHGILNTRFNQSTRSNNSLACNGTEGVTTELISIRDTPPSVTNHNF